MNHDMSIQVSTENGRVPVTVFHIAGEIDASSYERLQEMAREAQAGGMQNLVLDLSNVGFISSAGIRAIHAIFKMLRQDSPDESDEKIKRGLMDGTFKSPHLKLASPSRKVVENLKIAGLDMFLEIHRNLKEAVQSF